VTTERATDAINSLRPSAGPADYDGQGASPEATQLRRRRISTITPAGQALAGQSRFRRMAAWGGVCDRRCWSWCGQSQTESARGRYSRPARPTPQAVTLADVTRPNPRGVAWTRSTSSIARTRSGRVGFEALYRRCSPRRWRRDLDGDKTVVRAVPTNRQLGPPSVRPGTARSGQTVLSCPSRPARRLVAAF